MSTGRRQMNRKYENGIERACTFFIIDVFFFFYCRHAKFHLSSALFFFHVVRYRFRFHATTTNAPVYVGESLDHPRHHHHPSSHPADVSRFINRSRESLAAVPVISAFLFGFYFFHFHTSRFPLEIRESFPSDAYSGVQTGDTGQEYRRAEPLAVSCTYVCERPEGKN